MSINQARNNAINSTAQKMSKGEAPHTTKVSDGDGGRAAFKAQIDNYKDMILKSMVLASKYKMIDDGHGSGGGSGVKDAVDSLSKIVELSMQDMQMTQAEEAADAQKKAAYANMSHMVQKRVSIDDSKRYYSGKKENVNFQYNIAGKNIPVNAQIQSQISIYDAQGKKILSKTERARHIGGNSFIWDGKDDKGNMVEEGEYSISVTAAYTIPDNNAKPISLTTTTFKEGTVEAVTKDKNGKIKLIVDGQELDSDLVTSISDGGGSNAEEPQGTISDSLHYIGKEVQIKQEKVNYNGGSTNLTFISDADAQDAQVEVHVFNSKGDYVAYAKNDQNITAGQNTFIWKGLDVKSEAALKDMQTNRNFSYVPAGAYRYEVSVTTKNAQGVETTKKLNNDGKFTIDSIDNSSGKIKLISGKYKFDISDIKGISTKTPEKVQASHLALMQEGTAFIGKAVSFPDDIIPYQGNGDMDIPFIFPDLEAGYTLDSATIDIMDEKGVHIARIDKNAPEIYTANTAPTVNNLVADLNQFTPASQNLITDFITRQFNKTLDALNPDELKVLNTNIKNSFRAGEIFEGGYDALDQNAQIAQKLKNQGLNKIVWNGKSTAPGEAQSPAGDYTIAISYNIKNAANVVTSHNLDLTSKEIVVGTHIDPDTHTVMLELNKGRTIEYNRVNSVVLA